jgi:hypothetical protein
MSEVASGVCVWAELPPRGELHSPSLPRTPPAGAGERWNKGKKKWEEREGRM